MDDSMIRCDEIFEEEETKIITTNFNEKNAICKTQNLYILLAFILIPITLLMAVSVYCYVIRHKPKQKYLLLFYITNNKLNQVMH